MDQPEQLKRVLDEHRLEGAAVFSSSGGAVGKWSCNSLGRVSITQPEH